MARGIFFETRVVGNSPRGLLYVPPYPDRHCILSNKGFVSFVKACAFDEVYKNGSGKNILNCVSWPRDYDQIVVSVSWP